MEFPATGFTLELLATQAGLVLAVFLVTELAKAAVKGVAAIRWTAMVIGVVLAAAVTYFAGVTDPGAYLVAVFNGLLAAFTAMKAHEVIQHGTDGVTVNKVIADRYIKQ